MTLSVHFSISSFVCTYDILEECEELQAISLVGSKHKELFAVSIGYFKTGNVLSSALLSSRGDLYQVLFVLLAEVNFCHGTGCLICMKCTAWLEVTDVKRKSKHSMEISGVFHLSCWKQPRSVTAKQRQ